MNAVLTRPRPEWILADCHAGASSEADEGLLELLDQAVRVAADLWILGDLCAAWLATPKFLTPLQKSILDRCERIRVSGGTVRFIVGNRDFLVEDQVGRAFDEVVATEAIVVLGGLRTLVTHGDMIRTDDRNYRRWRRIVRSRPLERAVRLFPAGLAVALTQRLESGLSQTNRAYKTGVLPTQHLEALGRRARTLGAERVLVGHFHADTTLRVSDGVPVVIAPAWLDQRTILASQSDGSFVHLDLDATRMVTIPDPGFDKTL